MNNSLSSAVLHVALPVIFLSAATASASAQIHARTPLIEGQPGSVELRNAAPGHLAWFAFGFSGAGSGLCLGSSGPCLGFVGTPFVVPTAPVTASGTAAWAFSLPPNLAGLPVSSQVVTLDPGTQRFQVSNSIHGSIETIAALSDEFDGATLSRDFNIWNPNKFTVRVTQGEMRMRILRGGPANSWYANGEGGFVYKEVTGDFEVSARVRTYRASNPALPPTLSYNLGGLCIRDPHAPSGDHDWVHLAVGAGTSQVPLAVEDKSTVDSRSDLRLYPIPSNEIEIRMTRRGAAVSCFWRPVNSTTWTAMRSFQRPDLPSTVQVGIDLGWWPSTTPDVEIAVDWIRFAR